MASDQITVRLGAEFVSQLDDYAKEHGLNRAIVMRLALSNQFGRKPPKDAKERFGKSAGNPNPSEAGKAGAAARWGEREENQGES